MSNTQPKPTFDVEAIMTNAYDGYRQAQADKAYIEQLEYKLKEAKQTHLHLRQRIQAYSSELVSMYDQKVIDRQRFVKLWLTTVVIMTVLFIVAVSF